MSVDRSKRFALFLQLELDGYTSCPEELKQKGVLAFQGLLEEVRRTGESIEDRITEWYWDQPHDLPLGVYNTVLRCYAVYRNVWT